MENKRPREVIITTVVPGKCNFLGRKFSKLGEM